MPPPPPTIHLPHLDQSNESDLHLLTRLARRWDYVFKLLGKRLVFVPAGRGLAASGEPVTTVVPSWPTVGGIGPQWPTGRTGEGKRIPERADEGKPVFLLRHTCETPSRLNQWPYPASTRSHEAGPPLA